VNFLCPDRGFFNVFLLLRGKKELFFGSRTDSRVQLHFLCKMSEMSARLLPQRVHMQEVVLNGGKNDNRLTFQFFNNDTSHNNIAYILNF